MIPNLQKIQMPKKTHCSYVHVTLEQMTTGDQKTAADEEFKVQIDVRNGRNSRADVHVGPDPSELDSATEMIHDMSNLSTAKEMGQNLKKIQIRQMNAMKKAKVLAPSYTAQDLKTNKKQFTICFDHIEPTFMTDVFRESETGIMAREDALADAMSSLTHCLHPQLEELMDNM